MSKVVVKYKNGNMLIYTAWKGTVEIDDNVLSFQNYHSNGMVMIYVSSLEYVAVDDVILLENSEKVGE